MKKWKQKLAAILAIVLMMSNIQALQVSAASEQEGQAQEVEAETAFTGENAEAQEGEDGSESKVEENVDASESESEEDRDVSESESEDGTDVSETESKEDADAADSESKEDEDVSGSEEDDADSSEADESDDPDGNDQKEEKDEEISVCEHAELLYEASGDGVHQVICADCEEVLREEECMDEDQDQICDLCGWDAGEAKDPSANSLLPLPEKHIYPDLTAYTPVELTMVPFSEIFAGEDMQGVSTIAYAVNDYSDSDDYQVANYSDKVNMSRGTNYGLYGDTWEMIPGGEQLDVTASRYIVSPRITASKEWLVPEIVWEEDGTRTAVSIDNYRYLDYSYYVTNNRRELQIETTRIDSYYSKQFYVRLSINEAYTSVPNMKVFKGKFNSADQAANGTEITDQIFCSDLSQSGSGYEIEYYNYNWITIVSYDADGNVTGCLPMYLYLTNASNSNSYMSYSFFKIVDSDKEYPSRTYTSGGNNYQEREYELYDGYAADALYNVSVEYYKNGSWSNASLVTAAYAGTQKYGSIAAAQDAGATDIKDQLFSNDGYAADYSQGVWFSVFVGEDGTADQEIYYQLIKTKEGIATKNSGADVTFKGLLDSNDQEVPCYIVRNQDDSYGNGSYPTILVDNDVDISSLKPQFTTSAGVRLYAGATPDTNAVQESGVSIQNFANGAVQYTTASENGENQKNCWLTVIKTDNVAALQGLTYKLYTNSLADADAETRIENGVIYSKREIAFSSDYHDIFLTNMGTNVIPKLSVSLSADSNLEIDEYWTLNGNHDLAAYAGTTKTTYYGQLPNLAKVRLKVKDGVESGDEIKGTLTIQADGDDLMILELSGNAGLPQILTDTIPEAVKYVPYGIMLQNNNKYTDNKVRYALKSGTLPEGVQLYKNGEIYGVPKETGSFSFTVEMACSMSTQMVTKAFTLVVQDNTDANVDGATDEGYTVTQRIPNIVLGATEDHTFVSDGVLGEFKKVFLDGVELDPSQYTAVSGSTRLTISSQTLTSSNSTGRHTLGVEFRTSEDTLMKAAQNFYVTDGNKPSGGNSGNSGDHNDNSNNSDADSNGENGITNESSAAASGSLTDAQNDQKTGLIGKVIAALTGNGQGNAEAAEPIVYTVKAGDTLWKIAAEYYGDGALWTKVFEDNKDVIADANLIRVGQQIKLYQVQQSQSVGGADGTDAADAAANTYVVQKGDTLWQIAKKFYGKGWLWRVIYDANQDTISDYQSLKVGQIIIIP